MGMYEIHAVDIWKRDVLEEEEACKRHAGHNESQMVYGERKIRNRDGLLFQSSQSYIILRNMLFSLPLLTASGKNWLLVKLDHLPLDDIQAKGDLISVYLSVPLYLIFFRTI